ncbi:1-(5-phosphoribosyl)-5-[(5-phosphoribosylamino)methylideneamino]imidazole-4-carboxamide isomerase [Alkalibacillus silvisoli]|uniref:1-(5-phosphoribosyl)-5-[(5-phosphoribosylamino)methylideneamino] imidazole-4-carboxamide isomerase n=1 Tax=Alkalibacillus silvisoli TaxID=392823 RepID=A0ABN0ZMX0_9BACI
MRVFPAIDLINQQCVRLKQGDYNVQTIYGNPVEMANEWVKEGASFLHIVDLDAIKGDYSKNFGVIKQMIEEVSIPVQVGGGVRNIERINELLDIGVDRVILGTVAVKDPDFVKDVVERFGGEKIIVSVDARNGYVATDGWIEISNLKAIEFAYKLQKAGIQSIVYTDIAKDGMLQGPNLEALFQMNNLTELEVIASGGVTSIEDIRELSKANIYGAIVGKALYEGKISLLEIMKEPSIC